VAQQITTKKIIQEEAFRAIQPKTNKYIKSTKRGVSFKNVLQEKNSPSATTKQTGTDPCTYIMEKLNHILKLNRYIPETNEQCNILVK